MAGGRNIKDKSIFLHLWNYIIKYIINIAPLEENYFNNILLFNKHGFTNASLMNIYNDKMNPSHYQTYIIWTLTTTGYILYGHKPPLDILFGDKLLDILFGHEHLDIYYLDIDPC